VPRYSNSCCMSSPVMGVHSKKKLRSSFEKFEYFPLTPLPGRRWLYKWAVFGFAAACLAHQTDAIDPRRVISQYMRQVLGSEKGFQAGSVSAIAQTGDGYLWIGTEKGLFRFDGLTFKSFQRASPTSVPVGAVRHWLRTPRGICDSAAKYKHPQVP